MKGIEILEEYLKERGEEYVKNKDTIIVKKNNGITKIIPKILMKDKILIYPKDKKQLYVDNNLVAVIDLNNRRVIEINTITNIKSAKPYEVDNQKTRYIKVDSSTYFKLKYISRRYGLSPKETITALIDEVYKTEKEREKNVFV